MTFISSVLNPLKNLHMSVPERIHKSEDIRHYVYLELWFILSHHLSLFFFPLQDIFRTATCVNLYNTLHSL